MENINENIDNKENTENKGFFETVKATWQKVRGPVIGGLCGLLIGAAGVSLAGYKLVKDAEPAVEVKAENKVEDDVPFDENK